MLHIRDKKWKKCWCIYSFPIITQLLQNDNDFLNPLSGNQNFTVRAKSAEKKNSSISMKISTGGFRWHLLRICTQNLEIQNDRSNEAVQNVKIVNLKLLITNFLHKF